MLTPYEIKGYAHEDVQGYPHRAEKPVGRAKRRFVEGGVPGRDRRSREYGANYSGQLTYKKADDQFPDVWNMKLVHLFTPGELKRSLVQRM